MNGLLNWRTLAAAVTAATILVLPGPAKSWSNGVDGCNSFGTHDWILRTAMRVVNHGQVEWVIKGVALRATDDPDCKDGIDHASGTWWHVYDRWGRMNGSYRGFERDHTEKFYPGKWRFDPWDHVKKPGGSTIRGEFEIHGGRGNSSFANSGTQGCIRLKMGGIRGLHGKWNNKTDNRRKAKVFVYYR